eukprot:4992393-Prymnesium_polylepis.1
MTADCTAAHPTEPRLSHRRCTVSTSMDVRTSAGRHARRPSRARDGRRRRRGTKGDQHGVCDAAQVGEATHILAERTDREM